MDTHAQRERNISLRKREKMINKENVKERKMIN